MAVEGHSSSTPPCGVLSLRSPLRGPTTSAGYARRGTTRYCLPAWAMGPHPHRVLRTFLAAVEGREACRRHRFATRTRGRFTGATAYRWSAAYARGARNTGATAYRWWRRCTDMLRVRRLAEGTILGPVAVMESTVRQST